MNNFVNGLDSFCFWISGVDPDALIAHPDIAWEEVRVARGYTAILLVLLCLNFICTGLSAYDVFIDICALLTLPGYLAVVVLPVAFLWSSVVFCVLRFLIQIGHDADGNWWLRLKRLISMLPAWCLLPLLGMMASAPLQVRALSDDIRLSSVMVHWERLSTDLTDIQLRQVRMAKPTHNDCVTPLMRPQVVVDPTESIVQLAECKMQVQENSNDLESQAFSLQLLDAIHREIKDDGLISRVKLAFESAPGTSWLIALIMMCLYASPVLTRMLARKRAYEYIQYDRGRLKLMDVAGIELHAHEAFDAKGKPVPLNRYRHVEIEQRLVHAKYQAMTLASQERLAKWREAAQRRI